jgi:uridine phosphorylase
MEKEYPILEYDPENEAIIEPRTLIKPLAGIPECCVICFFQDVINHFVEQGLAEEIKSLRSEMGHHPIYKLRYGNDQTVALFQPGVGAPLAAGFLEEVIALGCRKFIVCGGAGVLDRDIAMGHLIVPVSAVRDEGTSYHYLPPAREVSPSSKAVEVIEAVLKRRKVNYLLAKTWTTDGLYRETRQKVSLRKSEGCLTVEMEAAALFAVAQFRQVELGQILYSGDNLDGETWDSRDWDKNWSIREKLVGLAVEACLAL